MKGVVSWLMIFIGVNGAVLLAQMPLSEREMLKQYPFLEAQAINLEFYGAEHSRRAFLNKLEEWAVWKEGNVNIAHIGGSHVQAGVLSRRFFKNIQYLNPEAPVKDAGFVFPFHLSGSNNPDFYKTESTAKWEGLRAALRSVNARWGLAAVTARTTDSSGTITLSPRAEKAPNWRFERVRVFLPGGDSIFSLYPDSSMMVVSSYRNAEAGYVEWEFAVEQQKLIFHWEKTDSAQKVLYLDGFQLLHSESGLVYHALGANGNSTESILRCSLWKEQLALLEPDLVIFGIGINDAHKSIREFKKYEFKANYRKMIEEIRRANPNAALLFITNNDSYYQRGPNPNALKVREAMRELSEEYGGWVFDLFGFMGGINASFTWQNHKLGKRDKIHFTREGYELQADAMYLALQKEFFAHLLKVFKDSQDE